MFIGKLENLLKNFIHKCFQVKEVEEVAEVGSPEPQTPQISSPIEEPTPVKVQPLSNTPTPEKVSSLCIDD